MRLVLVDDARLAGRVVDDGLARAGRAALADELLLPLHHFHDLLQLVLIQLLRRRVLVPCQARGLREEPAQLSLVEERFCRAEADTGNMCSAKRTHLWR